jgi:NAD-dependent SIR2 family protein deacetylase
MVERVVYVLGAGASYDAGGPLIRDFFSMQSGRSERVHSDYFLSDGKFRSLQAAYEKWASQTKDPNVEGFFQRVAYQRLMRKDFDTNLPGVTLNPETLYRYLVWYIAAYVKSSVADQGNPPGYYRDFARSLRQWGKRYSVLTFNYDLVLERALLREYGELDYKLGRIRGLKKFSKGVPLIKLHGSLNWSWCSGCEEVYVDEKPTAANYRREACPRSRCDTLLEPLIVPPDANKNASLDIISGLWRRAGSFLNQADRIVVVGYSLPDADTSAKELLMESVQRVSRFDVINSHPDALFAIEKKLNRKSDTPVATPFRDYVKAIA